MGISKKALCKRIEIQGTILTQLFCSLLLYFSITGQTSLTAIQMSPAQPFAAVMEESKCQEDSS